MEPETDAIISFSATVLLPISDKQPKITMKAIPSQPSYPLSWREYKVNLCFHSKKRQPKNVHRILPSSYRWAFPSRPNIHPPPSIVTEETVRENQEESMARPLIVEYTCDVVRQRATELRLIIKFRKGLVYQMIRQNLLMPIYFLCGWRVGV